MTKREEILLTRSRDDWLHAIKQKVFNQRDRLILERKLLDGLTHEQVAEQVGLSPQQVKKIVAKWSKSILK